MDTAGSLEAEDVFEIESISAAMDIGEVITTSEAGIVITEV